MSAKEIADTVRDCVMKHEKRVGVPMPELNEHVIEVEFETKKKKHSPNIHNLMGFATVTESNVDQIISEMGSKMEYRFPIMMLMRQCCVFLNSL